MTEFELVNVLLEVTLSLQSTASSSSCRHSSVALSICCLVPTVNAANGQGRQLMNFAWLLPGRVGLIHYSRRPPAPSPSLATVCPKRRQMPRRGAAVVSDDTAPMGCRGGNVGMERGGPAAMAHQPRGRKAGNTISTQESAGPPPWVHRRLLPKAPAAIGPNNSLELCCRQSLYVRQVGPRGWRPIEYSK